MIRRISNKSQQHGCMLPNSIYILRRIWKGQMWHWLVYSWISRSCWSLFSPDCFTCAFVFPEISCLKILWLFWCMKSGIESSSNLFGEPKTRAEAFCIANWDAIYLLWIMRRSSSLLQHIEVCTFLFILGFLFSTFHLARAWEIMYSSKLLVISHTGGNEIEQS